MGLHICAANCMKEHFMLCKLEVKMKDIIGWKYCKYWMMITYVYFGSFWVLESNGIQPQTLSNKNIMLNRDFEGRL